MTIDAEALPDLEVLHDLLRRENMAHSPEVWLYIHQLLANRAAQGRFPKNTAEFAYLLSPLVCKNPQQQYRMQAVISDWLNEEKPSAQAHISSPEQPATLAWKQRLRQFNRRTLYGVVVMLLLLLGLVLGFYFYQPTHKPKPLPVTADKPVSSTPANPDTDDTTVPITDWIDPNPLPMPEQLPANWQVLQHILGKGIPGLPVVFALLWLAWHYRQRTVLRNNAPQGEKILNGLNFDLAKDNAVAPFSGAEFAKAAAKLLYPVWTTSRRLHIGDSVIATAQNSGLFTPRYQQRHERPQYLILVQSVHGDDQTASYAELLVKALQQQKVDIRSYRFRDDPRRLIPKFQPLHGADTAPLSLTQLAQKYADARLIVMSDWNILFQPYHPDRSHDWVKEFNHWDKYNRVWLSLGYEDAQWAERAEKQAQQLNFRLLPLTSDNIVKMTQWLRQEGKQPEFLGETGESTEHLPAILSETADSWLDWRPPHGMDLKQLCQELQKWLGEEGFLLLQALAVFPKPLSPLQQILDIQLFSVDSKPSRFLDEKQQRLERENRLQRISRLPWLRFAYMPDYLRLRLLKSLNRSDRKKIRLAWTAILTSKESSEKVSVPINVPKDHKWQIKNLLAAQPKNSALNDAIFANILRGGKLGLLDFSLPHTFDRLFRKTDKWLDLRPAVLAISVAGLSVWGADWLWQSYGQGWVVKHWQQQIERENRDWRVEIIENQTETQPLGKRLARLLKTEKFKIRLFEKQFTAKQTHNEIVYARGGKYRAEQAAQALAWLSYNATVDLIENPKLARHTLQVRLSQTYQHSAGFKDELRFRAVKDDKDSLISEPEMVAIKGGCFQMGSPGSDDFEKQHQVCVKDFQIGKYEVTQAQWQSVMGNNPSSFKGENLPVEQVSWNDVQAFLKKLNATTGKTYRLPTEAEWEYAARAGTTTAYYWGNSIDCTKANYGYDTCKIKKTTVAGSYPANPWGLYDMAGNVWEWTCSVYAQNYDGRELKCGTKGFEFLMRGGSWHNVGRFARSAYRGRDGADNRNNDIGFRFALGLQAQ